MQKKRGHLKPDHAALYRIAEQQGGYFTAVQAGRIGFSHRLLWHHVRSGKLLRSTRGIYRLRRFPSTRFEDLYAAWLACGLKSAISHESALMVHDLSDVLPRETHLTVPRTASRRRRGMRLHTNRLRRKDIVRREGLQVTSVPRTIVDVAKAGLDENQIERAVRESLERGLTTRAELRARVKKSGGRAARLIRCLLEERRGRR